MRTIFRILGGVITCYIVICSLLYFFQERLIFIPEKLGRDFQFTFDKTFEELTFETRDQTKLSGLLFKSDSAKGLIFYLHGNGGSLRSWGNISATYTSMGYDLFMLDYRGYGKSEGTVCSESEMMDDIQTVYDVLRTRYNESNIIILGYSLGTGPATRLASENEPKFLILQAPFYNLPDLAKQQYMLIPMFLLKYKFETSKYIGQCSMPVVIFHGTDDNLISLHSSLRLKEHFKDTDRLFILHGEDHYAMSDNPVYVMEMEKLLLEDVGSNQANRLSINQN